MEVCTRLKNYLIDNSISQKDVAYLTGISLVKLNLSLNGRRKLTFEEFEKILIVLGESADEFIVVENKLKEK